MGCRRCSGEEEIPGPEISGFTADVTQINAGESITFSISSNVEDLTNYDLTKNPGAIQATFCTAPEIRNNLNNFLTEMIGTFILIFVILCFTEPKISASELSEVKVGLGSLGALPVGLLVFAIGLSLGGPTGYAINPARDLGPRIIHAMLPIPSKGGNGWNYSWIPVVGPVTGAFLATILHYLLPF